MADWFFRLGDMCSSVGYSGSAIISVMWWTRRLRSAAAVPSPYFVAQLMWPFLSIVDAAKVACSVGIARSDFGCLKSR